MKIRIMKIIFQILFFLLFFSSCNNSEKISYSISDFGDTLSKTEVLDNKNITKVTYYEDSENGETFISQVISYKDQVMHGITRNFHSNGHIKSEVEFKSGKIWNVNIYEDSSGNALDYGSIDNGNGRLKMYYRDISILKKEGNLVDGKKEGYWYSYCGDGVEVCDSILFIDGRDEFMNSWEEPGNLFIQEYN